MVVLVGGGRMAHNLIGLLEGAGRTIDCVLDDRPGESILGYPVRPLESYTGPEWDALLAIGEPKSRRSVVERRLPHGRFAWLSFIHPQAVVSQYARLGEGSFVAPFTTVADAVLGRHVMLMPFTLLGAKVQVGAFSMISSHCGVSSDVRIGEECLVGMGAKIMAGVTIGDRCRIAANAVVRKDLPDGSLYSPEARLRTVRAT